MASICSLITIWIAVYPAHINTPGMRVTLRDSSLNLIDHVDVDWATVNAAGFGWISADFSTLNGGSAYTFAGGEDFYIGCQAISDGDDTLAIVSDDGSSASGRMKMYIGAPYNGWYAWSGEYSYLMTADVCCVTYPYDSCSYESDWPTYGGNFSRTNASASGLHNGNDSLTLAWIYEGSGITGYNSPVIYKDTIIYCYHNELVCIDLLTGSLIWNYPYDGSIIGNGIYATPTIYNFDDYGDSVTLVFCPGGDAGSFSAFNLSTGDVYWTRDYTHHDNHDITWGPSIIVDDLGVPILIYPDDRGYFYAVEALTGSPFDGWSIPGNNPAYYGGPIYRGLATNGEYFYISIPSYNYGVGNVVCAKVSNGFIKWSLQHIDGLQLCNLDPNNCYGEYFPGSIAYDNDDGDSTLYVVSL